jgi:c-di-GMP-binding flagellar brake protein YcgR
MSTDHRPVSESSAGGVGTTAVRLRHEGGTLRARLMDISCGGVGVLAARALPDGTLVTIEVGGDAGTGPDLLALPAAVRHSSTASGGWFRLGIEFLPMDEQTAARVAQTVKRFERRQARRAPVWQA